MSQMEVEVRGRFNKVVRVTRYNTTTRPPPEINEIFEDLVRSVPRRGYFATKSNLLGAARPRHEEYKRRGSLDDLHRFLMNCDVIIRLEHIFDGWFVNVDRIQAVQNAIARKAELPSLTTVEKVRQLKMLLKKYKLTAKANPENVEDVEEEADPDSEEDDGFMTETSIRLFEDVAFVSALSDEELSAFELDLAGHAGSVNANLVSVQEEIRLRKERVELRRKLEEELSQTKEAKLRAEGLAESAEREAEEAQAAAEAALHSAEAAAKSAKEAKAKLSEATSKISRLKSQLEGLK